MLHAIGSEDGMLSCFQCGSMWESEEDVRQAGSCEGSDGVHTQNCACPCCAYGRAYGEPCEHLDQRCRPGPLAAVQDEAEELMDRFGLAGLADLAQSGNITGAVRDTVKELRDRRPSHRLTLPGEHRVYVTINNVVNYITHPDE